MDVALASAEERLGQTLRGKYTIEAILGVGGTAAVYRATHRNGHRVAVKMLHPYLCKSKDLRARFLREGYLANLLNHRGTVRVLDDDVTEDGAVFLVLELLEGQTLEELREASVTGIPLEEVLRLAEELLNVLEVAHDHGVVHRDIKPANLFLTTDNQLKVLDFGIARIVDEIGSASSTKTGTMMGTPAFMPPEQALSRPKEVDAQSDLWAVGATIFNLLTGEHVHSAESTPEHLVKAATRPARSIRDAWPEAPPALDAFLTKALSFYKAERFLCAAEMRDELRHVRNTPGAVSPTLPAPKPRTSDQPTVVAPRDIDDSVRAMTMSGGEIGRATQPSNLAKRRRSWALVGAIGAVAVLLSLGGTIAFVATRGPTPIKTAARPPAGDPPPIPATIASPRPALPTARPPSTAATATAAPTPTVATPALKPATRPPPPARPPPQVKTATAPPPATAAATAKPTAKPAATVDVYKPF